MPRLVAVVTYSQLHGSVGGKRISHCKAGSVSPQTCLSRACVCTAAGRSALVAPGPTLHVLISPGARPAAVGSGGHTSVLTSHRCTQGKSQRTGMQPVQCIECM